MLYPYIYINGSYLPKEDAKVPVYDLGLLRGMGIFDFFRVIEGVPVFAEDHIMRLRNSIRLMNMKDNASDEEWLSRIRGIIEKNKADRAGFRIVVTGGYSEDGYSIPEEQNVYLMLHDLPQSDPGQYSSGVKLITDDFQRELPEAKTTIYVQSMRLQGEMKKQGAYEVLYHFNGKILECSRCNIFFIDADNKIHTPKQDMLKGVTRKQIIQLVRNEGIEVVERDIDLNEIESMAGAFLTATTKGALPVVNIGNKSIANGQVHPLALRINDMYNQSVRNYIEKVRATTL